MEYTELQKVRFKESFARKQKRQLVVAFPVLAAFVAVILGQEPGSHSIYGLPVVAWVPIFAILIVAVLIFSSRNWRCPACDGYLGRGFHPTFCPKCGVQLRS
jgi:hypothetical protein